MTDVRQGERETSPVVQYHSPQELYKVVDLVLPRVGCGIEGTLHILIEINQGC